ncbi:MAG: leucine-rich repeat domain-containing protein [Bacteroidales bacterium]|nr:leucine-rich repeat domain-containing protein [Bacteroidales bacterium]
MSFSRATIVFSILYLYIGNSAFSSTGLTSVTLPTDMISIGTYSFNECKSLTTVTVPLNTPPEEYVPGNSHWFNGCDVLTAIYVPAGRVDTYKAAGGWSDYADKIQAIPAP